MKKSLFASCLLVIPFMMASAPHTEPGPILPMGEQARVLANMLLNPQLQHCVQTFQQDAPRVQSVTMQNMKPGLTHYQVTGVVLSGGDMAREMVRLNVAETVERGFGGNPVTSYRCNVTRN